MKRKRRARPEAEPGAVARLVRETKLRILRGTRRPVLYDGLLGWHATMGRHPMVVKAPTSARVARYGSVPIYLEPAP